MQKNKKSVDLLLLYVILSLMGLTFFSCGDKRAADGEPPLLDSLNEKCYTLLMQLQTDSLRMVAEEFMKAAPQPSRQYFKAKQYYINSYFNARDFDKVLSLLDETEQMPYFGDYPAVVCDYLYTRARTFQYSERYPEAIDAFKRCLTFTPKEEEQQSKVVPSVEAAMTQLMNTFILSNKVEDGYRYFNLMKNKPVPVIRRFLLRDLYIHLSYLASQSGHGDEASRLVDFAFMMQLNDSTPQKLFRDYSYAAIVNYSRLAMREQVIQWLERAMAEADNYEYTAGVQWSVDLLANLYWQSNNIIEGTELQYKALRMSQKRGNKGAECSCYISLANLYKKWELYKQADEYADQALAVILPTDDMKFQGEAFRTKAKVKSALNQSDSAIYYYAKSSECSEKAQQAVDKLASDAGMAGVLIDHCVGDSLVKGVEMMRKVLQEPIASDAKSYNFYCLAKGLIKQGKHLEGEAVLDSMYRQMSQSENITYADGVLEYVVDYYLSQGNGTKVRQYASLYRKQTDLRFDEKISRKVASAMVEYQTEKKEQQLKLANAELSVKDLRIKFYLVALTLLVFAIGGGILWYLHKRKIQKNIQLLAEQEKLIALRDRELAESRLHEQETQLENALESLREANNQSEEMREQLDEFLANRENKQNILSVTPSLLREKGEIKFRRYFTQLYPGFLISLRENISDITRGEEVLSMLIALNQNMDEIADILCIERKSVKMSRYRLRKKISVDAEISLDDFIKGLLSAV